MVKLFEPIFRTLYKLKPPWFILSIFISFLRWIYRIPDEQVKIREASLDWTCRHTRNFKHIARGPWQELGWGRVGLGKAGRRGNKARDGGRREREGGGSVTSGKWEHAEVCGHCIQRPSEQSWRAKAGGGHWDFRGRTTVDPRWAEVAQESAFQMHNHCIHEVR